MKTIEDLLVITELRNNEEFIKKYKLTEEDLNFFDNIIKEGRQPAIAKADEILEIFDVDKELAWLFFDQPDTFKQLQDKEFYLFDCTLAYGITRGDDLDFRKIMIAEMHYMPYCKTRKDIKEQYNLTDEEIDTYIKDKLLEHWCYYPASEDHAFFVLTQSFRDMYEV